MTLVDRSWQEGLAPGEITGSSIGWPSYVILYNILLTSAKNQMSEQGLNRRQIYKKQKLLETAEIFYCECGKNYLTFSALYLHARNKHNVKLTTKRSSQNCKIEEKGDKTFVTYFTTSPSIQSASPELRSSIGHSINQNSQPGPNSEQPPLALIDRYLAQEQSRLSPQQLHVLAHFKTYFQIISGQPQPLTDHQDPSLYFNDFIAFYLPGRLQHSNSLSQSSPIPETTIIQFHQWLKTHRLTEYDLSHCPSINNQFCY